MILQTINVGSHIEPDTKFMHFKMVNKVSWMTYVLKKNPKMHLSKSGSYHICIF